MHIIRQNYSLITPYYKKNGIALLFIGTTPIEKINTSPIDTYCLGSCIVKSDNPRALTSEQIKEVMNFLDHLLEESPDVESLIIHTDLGHMATTGELASAIHHYLSFRGKQNKDDYYRYDVDDKIEKKYFEVVEEFIAEKHPLL